MNSADIQSIREKWAKIEHFVPREESTVADWPPECPGEHCGMCNGEACGKCGAGLCGSPEEPCEHDVTDRHQGDYVHPTREAEEPKTVPAIDVPGLCDALEEAWSRCDALERDHLHNCREMEREIAIRDMAAAEMADVEWRAEAGLADPGMGAGLPGEDPRKWCAYYRALWHISREKVAIAGAVMERILRRLHRQRKALRAANLRDRKRKVECGLDLMPEMERAINVLQEPTVRPWAMFMARMLAKVRAERDELAVIIADGRQRDAAPPDHVHIIFIGHINPGGCPCGHPRGTFFAPELAREVTCLKCLQEFAVAAQGEMSTLKRQRGPGTPETCRACGERFVRYPGDSFRYVAGAAGGMPICEACHQKEAVANA